MQYLSIRQCCLNNSGRSVAGATCTNIVIKRYNTAVNAISIWKHNLFAHYIFYKHLCVYMIILLLICIYHYDAIIKCIVHKNIIISVNGLSIEWPFPVNNYVYTEPTLVDDHF